MSSRKDSFFDDDDIDVPQEQQQPEQDHPPPAPLARKLPPNDEKLHETIDDQTLTPYSTAQQSSSRPTSPPQTAQRPMSRQASLSSSHSGSPLAASESQLTNEKANESRSASVRSTRTNSFAPDEYEQDFEEEKTTDKPLIRQYSKVNVDVQTDAVVLRDKSMQTETVDTEPTLKTTTHKISFRSEVKKLTAPLVKNLLDQNISSTLPIISFCQPFSMTSHINDIILAMPRHLMIINNQNAVSVYPWHQSVESTTTILECFWCSFLYKLLVTTLEDNCLHIYDFISIIDSVKLRGRPLSIKHESYQAMHKNSSLLLPSSSQYKSLPAIWSQTRFTKSNSLGIYYCYISDRQSSCMLARIDHNKRQHIKAIDCSGGSLSNNNTRVGAMGLSEERVAIVLTNLIMTIYDAETLLGLKQINLSRWNGCTISAVNSIMYLWKTWLIFDPIENKVVGLGKQKRQFVKYLPEQPINACSMDNGTLALWLGYPGALLFYRVLE